MDNEYISSELTQAQHAATCVNTKVRAYAWFVVALAACFYCYEYFLRISPSVMAHDLRMAFRLNGANFGNLADFYYYIYTPMQFFVGLLMDRFGPKRLLTLACLSCAAGSFVFSISHAFYLAAAGRFLIGFGSAFAFVGAMKLASIWLPRDRFAVVSGGITALGMLGAMFGDVMLTELVSTVGWRGTMVEAAILGLVLAAALFLFIRDRKTKHKKTIAERLDADFPFLLRGLLHALRKPQIWVVGIIGALLYLALTAFAELWSIPYFKSVYGFTSVQAAALNTAIFLGWVFGGPLLGFISDKIRSRRRVLMWASLAAAVMSGVIFVLPGAYSFSTLYVLLMLFGVATSAQVLVFACGKELNSDKMAGTSIALINAFVMLGGLIFQPLIGLVLDLEAGTSTSPAATLAAFSSQDYAHAMWALPVCMLLAFGLTFLLGKDHVRPREAQRPPHKIIS